MERRGCGGVWGGAANKHFTLGCSQVVCGRIHLVSRETAAASFPMFVWFYFCASVQLGILRHFRGVELCCVYLAAVWRGAKSCGGASPAPTEVSGWGRIKEAEQQGGWKKSQQVHG